MRKMMRVLRKYFACLRVWVLGVAYNFVPQPEKQNTSLQPGK